MSGELSLDLDLYRYTDQGPARVCLPFTEIVLSEHEIC